MSKRFDIPALAAAAAAIAAVALYQASCNAYPSGASNTSIGIVSGVCAVLLMALCGFGLGGGRARSVMILAAGLLTVLFLYQFAMGRVAIAADVYFIPVNYPAEEDIAMNRTIAGLSAALVSFLSITWDAFTAKV